MPPLVTSSTGASSSSSRWPVARRPDRFAACGPLEARQPFVRCRLGSFVKSVIVHFLHCLELRNQLVQHAHAAESLGVHECGAFSRVANVAFASPALKRFLPALGQISEKFFADWTTDPCLAIHRCYHCHSLLLLGVGLVVGVRQERPTCLGRPIAERLPLELFPGCRLWASRRHRMPAQRSPAASGAAGRWSSGGRGPP